MKKTLIVCLVSTFLLFNNDRLHAQAFKAGVFDIDLMVQAMPGYRIVDSLVQIYEYDSLGLENQYNQMEFQRLDSTYKADSVLVAEGKKPKMFLDKIAEERRKVGLTIVYWQQIAQNKSNAKRGELAQPLYQAVATAYKKVLARKKYSIILKPQTYEAGFAIDNMFLSVARELKLGQLPQELLYLGDDPDVSPAKPGTPATKPKAK
jgi:hypothetical protein